VVGDGRPLVGIGLRVELGRVGLGRFAFVSRLVFGEGFGTVSDVLSGPGGLYVLSLSNNALYRITTAPTGAPRESSLVAVPEPASLSLVVIGSVFVMRRRIRR